MVTHNPILHDLLHEAYLLKLEFDHSWPHKDALEASLEPTHVTKTTHFPYIK